MYAKITLITEFQDENNAFFFLTEGCFRIYWIMQPTIWLSIFKFTLAFSYENYFKTFKLFWFTLKYIVHDQKSLCSVLRLHLLVLSETDSEVNNSLLILVWTNTNLLQFSQNTLLKSIYAQLLLSSDVIGRERQINKIVCCI